MKELIFLWSSQTGRAKACARRAHRILQSSNCKLMENGAESDVIIRPTMSFDQLGPASFLSLGSTSRNSPPVLILFVSTTGDGEQCDSIRETWKLLLRKSLAPDLLSRVCFALFCLGDRAYGPDSYCAAGRKLGSRLVQLGARPFCSIGYGDDGTPNGGVFNDLDVWLQETLLPCFLLSKISSYELYRPFSYHTVLEGTAAGETIEACHEEWLSHEFHDSYSIFFASLCPMDAYTCINNQEQSSHVTPYIGKVKSNIRITDESWFQDTRHITIQIDEYKYMMDNQLPYYAGDIATILPSNSNTLVSRFLLVLTKSLAEKVDIPIHINVSCTPGTQVKWPSHATLRGLLTYCADIASLPEREDLRSLSFCCNPCHPYGLEQKKKLQSLSELSGNALYADYILREKRNWADVLYDFDSIRFESSNTCASLNDSYIPLSLDYLLEILPNIRPRHYSIASSPSFYLFNDKESKGCTIELCVNMVQGTTPRGRVFEGLCSSYLSRATLSENVRLWIRPGSFQRLPLRLIDTKFEIPILCIGVGTGIAPLRALIHERIAVWKRSRPDSHCGESDHILIFGCRKQNSDFYYKNEWEAMIQSKYLQLYPAFSQEYSHKLYVQRVLREAENGQLVLRHILEKRGAIYIAGNCKMAGAVKAEILELLAKYVGGIDEGKRIMKNMHIDGLLAIEAWG